MISLIGILPARSRPRKRQKTRPVSSSHQEVEIDSTSHEEDVGNEEQNATYENYHWALYSRADESGWSRPRDRRAFRKKIAKSARPSRRAALVDSVVDDGT